MGAGASAGGALEWEPSCLTSASEVLRQIQSGEKRCVDVVRAALDRIALLETSDTPLNACVETLGEGALARAAEVDAKVIHKETLGSLEGLPIVVKVNIDVKGALTTASTEALKAWRPPFHAPCVARLVDAGAIVIARANMCELAVGFSGASPVHGLCLNPRNPGINCGGSSSGTAAAVAAGVASCGLGSDTGGSLRGPAALCGVVGFRPSTGRWPAAGVVPVSSLRDTPGPIGASVADVCLLDAAATRTELVAAMDVANVKFGVPRDWIASAPSGLDENAAAALAAASAALRKSGAVVEDVEGFHAVTETNRDTWPVPRIPAPFEDCRADLDAYLAYHQDALGLDVEALRPLSKPERKLYFASLDDAALKLIAQRASVDVDALPELLDAIGTLSVDAIQGKMASPHIRAMFDPPKIPQDILDQRMGRSDDPGPAAANLTELKGRASDQKLLQRSVEQDAAVVAEVVAERTKATAAGVTQLEAAYRGFFEAHGIRCLLLPTFPLAPGRIDVPGYAGKAFANEYFWLFRLNEIPVPSITLPTTVLFPGSRIPASVLLYGLDDAELLGIARTLEEALGGVSDWTLAAFGGQRPEGP